MSTMLEPILDLYCKVLAHDNRGQHGLSDLVH